MWRRQDKADLETCNAELLDLEVRYMTVDFAEGGTIGSKGLQQRDGIGSTGSSWGSKGCSTESRAQVLFTMSLGGVCRLAM
jgi:hypothetical protein